eukprot:TRINITY_DN71888_c0_g1_i1.p1 TRINITY_DN71888_c0_g1~~TRINITY_DN71888_c0_g1_i1.p1  ORF type:complete len:262 (+),score=65.93 TRINITY_DN71888_c0_g1_i1:158-943(+)
MWVAGLASAFAIKLTSSIDDVVWLAPFLTSNLSFAAKGQNAGIYITVCLTQTLVAMAIAYSGNTIVEYLTKDSKGAWSTDKILTVGASVLLILFGIKLVYEYVTEEDEDNGGNGDKAESREVPSQAPKGPAYDKVATDENAPAPAAADVEAAVAPLNVEDKEAVGEERSGANKTGGAWTLFVIAFVGSVDDLTLFVPMLVGKAFDLAQLMLGAFSAAAFIVTLCLCIGMCKPIADFLSSVPLFVIVGLFALVLMVKGITMD